MSTSGPSDPTRPPTPTQTWSPYPVQDWDALPPPQPPPGSEYVSPDWAPPRDPRPGWVPYLIVALVGVLVAGGFLVADRVGDRAFSTRAQEFVPEDGAVLHTVRQSGGGGTETPYVTESARFVGPEEFTALDFTFGTAVLSATGLDLDGLAGLPFWRTTTTQIGNPESTQQLVRVYQVDGPIVLLGESGPGVAHVYQPGLVELPADVAAGRSWSGSGSAGTTLDYRSEFRAEPADRGCLQVTGSITYTEKSGKPSSTSAVHRAWCPGEGPTFDETRTGDQVDTFTRPRTASTPPKIATTSEPVAWRDPQVWRNQRFSSVSIDQNFGQGIMTGAPSGVPPVVTASGLVVRASSSSDLVVFTPKTPTEWTSLWRMRPGATVVSLTAFGDVVVATTSARQVVGYSVSGVRLWQHDLDEVAFQGPARVDDTRIAVVDNGGTVRVLDLASGAERWRRNLRTDVLAAPVADGRAVVVADGGGTLTAFDSDDGSERWQRELDVSGATIAGDTVVTHSAATLTAISIEDGRTRWLEPLTGTVDVLTNFGGRVVLATQLSTTIRDEGGAVRAAFDPYVLVTVTSDHLVGWGNRQAEVIDENLTVLTTLDTPDRNLTTGGNWPVADRFGVMLFGADWSFQTWSDQP